ncbi:MAG: hypothetical protein ACQEVA_01315 [Myxococcota bacterium]
MDSLKTKHIVIFWAAVLGIMSLACAAQQQEQQVETYEPTFEKVQLEPGEKVDLAVAIIDPQFEDDAADYYTLIRDRDSVGLRMVDAMKDAFSDILIAKGFNTTGPFDSRDEMTYPQKKSVAFAVYPQFDINPRVKVENLQRNTTQNYSGQTQVRTTCDLKLRGRGAIKLVAIETLSGQKLWFKNVDVETPSKTYSATENGCSENPNRWPVPLQNDWARMHEEMYNKSVQSFKDYISVEEFRTIKANADEVREKTTF